MIKEYLDYKKASKIQDKISPLLPTGVECVLTRSGHRYKETELKIQNRFGSERELSRKENDMKELINDELGVILNSVDYDVNNPLFEINKNKKWYSENEIKEKSILFIKEKLFEEYDFGSEEDIVQNFVKYLFEPKIKKDDF